jgi:hypothetical protein
MEHLLVNLPWEARVGGPVHFMCMIRNKARVDGCIAEALGCKEITNFSSRPGFQTKSEYSSHMCPGTFLFHTYEQKCSQITKCHK